METAVGALSLRESLALPYFYNRFGPTGSGPNTNLVYAAALHGPLDAEALRRAFDELAQDTPELRGFFSGPDAPPARLISDASPPFVYIDAERDGLALKRAVRAAADRRFVLNSYPLVEATLVRRGPNRHVLVIAAHHLLLDGFSIVMLLRSISSRMRKRRRPSRPAFDVGAEAKARLAFLQSNEAADLKARAAEWIAPAEAALWPPRPVVFPTPDERHGLVRLAPEPAAAAARALGLRATALHRLLFVLLQHALTGARHLAFSEAHGNRPADRPDLFGFLSDDYLARVDLDPELSAAEAALRIDAALEKAKGFAAIPCSRILQTLRPDARPLPRFHFNPLGIAAAALRLPGVTARPFRIMPAYSVAEVVFVSGDLERLFIALAHGSVEGVDLAGVDRRLNMIVERLADPQVRVRQLMADLP